MASSTFSSLVLLLAVLSVATEAKDHIVSWKVPANESDLHKWAESSRFQVGDTLVFNHFSKKDSVVQVTRDAYLSCNATDPIAVYKGGEAKKQLNHSGPFYFISGLHDNCEKGEKVIVVVLSPRKVGPSPAPSPALSTLSAGPAVAPSSGVARFKASLAAVTVGFGVLAGFYLV